jgi:hypothetical protein
VDSKETQEAEVFMSEHQRRKRRTQRGNARECRHSEYSKWKIKGD